MKHQVNIYEIFLDQPNVDVSSWQELLLQISRYHNKLSSWRIYMIREQNLIHYYLVSNASMPACLNTAHFLLKTVNIELPNPQGIISRGLYKHAQDNFATILQDLAKNQYKLTFACLYFRSFKNLFRGEALVYYEKLGKTYVKQTPLFMPAKLLAIDFSKTKSLLFKKFPKYLKLEKVTKLLSSDSSRALFRIDPFPYLDTAQYLHHNSYDFAKHSLIIGGSGSGKSRFLASFIDKIYQTSPDQYKIVVIDPHDALYQDCRHISSQSVINFQNLANSIDLFCAQAEDIHASVELTLTLFRSLLNDNYNGLVERVLRYSAYLLIYIDQFSFLTLRKLLLDLDYRNQIITKYKDDLPTSVSQFFLADFSAIRSQNYDKAISPIIAFIDEMQMVPVFNSEQRLTNLSAQVNSCFLNIFSLNRLKLGSKVVKTIAGLLMQQLFLFAEQKPNQHLIIIIDEVSVIQNPIISQFLSELRKYNASVIIAGQYFDQIEPDLQAAIFANTSNYYLFRTSRRDAELLSKNLKISLEGSKSPDDQINLLTGLKLRECLVQISAKDELLPIFKASTTDFACEMPEIKPQDNKILYNEDKILEQEFNFPNHDNTPESSNDNDITQFNFDINCDVKAEDLVNTFTTSHRTKKKG